MADLAQATATTAEVELAGTKRTLGKMTVRDRLGILNELRTIHREQLQERCKAAGLDAAQTFIELDKFDGEPMGLMEFAKFVDSPEGQLRILALLLAKVIGQAEADKVVDALPVDTNVVQIIAPLCGFSLHTPEEAVPGDDAVKINPATGRPFAYGDETV